MYLFGYGRHTVDKCYKLHGYPPGYKAKQKHGSGLYTGHVSHPNNIVANQVFGSIPGQSQENIGKFMQSLDSGQYHKLMTMLSTHLKAAKVEDECNSANHVSGICLSTSITQISSSPKCLVLDSGVTSHVCFSRACF